MTIFKLVKEIRSKTGELHFRRYRIIETKWFSIYLHYIAKSDEDAHRHNHPWDFTSVVLSGSYTEEYSLFNIVRTRASKLINSHIYEEYHKLTILKPVWSLVFCGKRINENWGYIVDGLHIHHEEYRKMKHNKEFERE